LKKAGKHVKALHKIASGNDEPGHVVAQKIKDLAGSLKSPYAANYGTKLLGWLEKKHGAAAGSFGKATAAAGKSTGTAHLIGQPAASTAPASSEPTKSAKLESGSEKPEWMKELFSGGESSSSMKGLSQVEKVEALGQKLANQTEHDPAKETSKI